MPEIEIHYPDGLVGYKTLTPDAPLVVGSGSGCDVQIDAPEVAKKHFLFRWSNSGNTWRFDVGKEYDGVQINGKPSKGEAIGPDDEVSLGDYTFIFRDSGAARPVEDVAAMRPVVMTNYEERDYYTPLLQQKTFRTILGTIITVVIIGGVSYFGFHATRSDKMYNAAKKSLDDTNYEKAAKEFQEFRDNYPKDRRIGKAKVFQDVANIHGLLQSGQQFGAALFAAERTLKDNDKSPSLRDPEVMPALIKPLVDTGRGAADRAKDVRTRIDTDSLRIAKAALQLAERVGPREGVLATEYDAAMELTQKAAAAIEKETLRRETVDRMQKAIEAKTPMVVYAEHRKLYARYPDLKLDAESLAKRAEARKIEQAMTVFKPAENQPAAAPAPNAAPARAPITRKVLGDAKPSERLQVLQAADTLFGVDSGSGEVKWSLPVGFDPAFAPQPVDGGVFVHRTRDNALLVVDPATGSERWATPLGNKKLRYISRPLAHLGRVYICGFDSKDEKFGRLYVFTLDRGKYLGEVVFPQPLAGMPVLDKKRQTLLVPGDQATMYAINPSNNQCSAVYQMGHEPGTLAWVPMLAGRFLFSIENYAPGKSTLRVFVLSGDDGSLRERGIGELGQLPGSVRRDPVLTGTRLFITTDRDAFLAFDLGGEDDEKPIQAAAQNVPPVAAKTTPDAPYPVAVKDDQFWTVGNSVRFFQLRRGSLGTVNPTEKFEVDGPAAIPPLLDGELLILGSRVNEGGVQIRCIDAGNRKWKWQLDLVQPPKTVQADPAKKDNLLLTLAAGSTMSVSLGDLTKSEPLQLPAAPADRPFEADVDYEDVPGWTEGVVQWAGVGRREMRAFPRNKPARKFMLTSPAAAYPGPFGTGMIVPCQDGLVYWIDPATGADLAEPLGVPFIDGRPVELGTGVGVAEDAAVVVAGSSLVRIQVERKGFPHFKPQTRVELPDAPDPMKVDPAVLKRWLASIHLAKMGDRLLVAAGKNLYRVRTDDLSVEKKFSLGGNCPAPPSRIGQIVVFATDHRELVAFGAADAMQPADLRWRLKLPRAPLGPPKAQGEDAFWLAFADGKLEEHSVADGKPRRQLDAGRNLLGGPWFVSDRLVVLTPVGGLAALEMR